VLKTKNRSPLKQAYAEIDYQRKPKYLKAAQKLLVSKDLDNLFQTDDSQWQADTMVRQVLLDSGVIRRAHENVPQLRSNTSMVRRPTLKKQEFSPQVISKELMRRRSPVRCLEYLS
jgi:hypothetical protein